jgi:high affinity Mn2+ porin
MSRSNTWRGIRVGIRQVRRAEALLVRSTVITLLKSVVLPMALGFSAVQPGRAQAAEAPAAGVEAADQAVESAPEKWMLRFQTTAIYEYKPAFAALYSGPNSLSTQAVNSWSVSGTAFLGVRPWAGGELYLDPELIAGLPFSNLTGLGGFPNGELQKVTATTPKVYIPRAFLRQTWELGGGTVPVESGLNQLAGTVDKQRLVLTAGKMAIVDIFDNNAFSHDARTQFMNWAAIDYGAYDFAADSRGYTWGAALEYYHDQWAVRAGRFLVPVESNGGPPMNWHFLQFYGDQLEVERGYEIAAQPGRLRLLYFRNRENMGNFQDALNFAAEFGGTPEVSNVRRPQSKHGYGLNVEQNLTSDVGVFSRLIWADGQTEEYSYTEIDRSILAGVSVKGTRWGRSQDTVGAAFIANYLSSVDQAYLGAGGLGFFIGDGRLNYRPEQIAEVYYSIDVYKTSWITLDFQHVVNPAYNHDRGPVSFAGVRLHAEF